MSEPGVPPPPPAGTTNVAAIVGFVSGILSVVMILFFSIIIGGGLALVAILAGSYGMQEAKKGRGGHALGLTGMILGLVGVGLQLYEKIAN